MLKSELLEKIKDIAEDADINETLQGIEGLIKPLDVTSIGLEDFKNVLENNKEIATYVQSTIDSKVGKGVASFKEKTLPKLIDEGVKAAQNKTKSPTEIALEELQAKFDALEKEKARADMSTKYTKVLADKGLSSELLDFVLGVDDETTDKNIETLSNIINSSVTAGIEKEFHKDNPIPHKGEGTSNLTGVEQAFFERNPSLMQQQ